MPITIHKKLKKYLKTDSKWERRVGNLIDLLEPILETSPEFFPQYTNHGLAHVNTVLFLADNLIHSKAGLSSREAACLIAAILIHDLGMFLTPDGVIMLMTPEWDRLRIQNYDKQGWKDDWEQYIASVQRLPAAQQIRYFGQEVQADKVTLDPNKMLPMDKLVIGEFLRRNHPRLAHEIAAFGLPGTTVQNLLEKAGFDEANAKMIGLIARSHGMSLRKVEEHLSTGSHPSNLPVYYLMSVLRLADYLDASKERAPMVRLNQQKLTSELSKEEWALNQCFVITDSKFYPENKHYSIMAIPQTSSEYARLERWLNYVQRELDLCWAVLAEKYPKSKLKLSIHRIVCTMYEADTFSDLSAKILPREVKVTANPEIVKLMMEPLYGDNPTYGVRELLQNAVDACVERKRWENEHGNANYKGLVDIRIENNTFTITDNGMGMNEDVLLNYYLSAGSSYRNSETWKADNAPDNVSQVARTGKFGVGFLAAFLLGDRIQVHTQHVKDERGYEFSFDQESMPLDVERKQRPPHASTPGDCTGTTITIELRDGVHKSLQDAEWPEWYNWYAFDDPEVRYTIDNEPKKHHDSKLHRLISKNDDWLELPTSGFESYRWKPNWNAEPTEFYCNGIRIYHRFPEDLESHGLKIRYPHISVIDKQGKLNVDLARKDLKEVPAEEALLREVFRWHIAQLLLIPWCSEEDHQQNFIEGFPLHFTDVRRRLPFLLSSGGFNLNYISLIPVLVPNEYVVLFYEGLNPLDARISAHRFLKNDIPCAIVSSANDLTGKASRRLLADGYYEKKFSYSSPGAFTNDFLNNSAGLLDHANIKYSLSRYTSAVWFRSDVPESLSLSMRIRSDLQHSLSSPVDKLRTGFLRNLYLSQKPSMPIDPNQFSIEQFPAVLQVIPDLSDYAFYGHTDSLFAQTMKKTLIAEPGWPQDFWIPFDMEERKKKFREAFDDLEGYMEHIKKNGYL